MRHADAPLRPENAAVVRRRRAPGLFCTMVLLPACSALPRFTVPQAQQAAEVFEGGFGNRLEVHRQCAADATNTEDLVRCMEGKGYAFIAPGTMYPANECWSLRNSASADPLPQPFCFQRTGAPAAD